MSGVRVGVDPGLSGALVAVDTGAIIAYTDMPTVATTVNGRTKHVIDPYGVLSWLVNVGPVEMVTIEQVQGVQGSGATSAFSFGKGCGIIEGVVVALGRRWQYVTPQRWTKHYGIGADKGLHRACAMRLFPDDAGIFARAKDDGRADAALLAIWGTP